MSGTFNVSRNVFHHEFFADQKFSEREAWIWLIGEASWKSRPFCVAGTTVDLERGQLATSVRFLAETWGWSKSAVHRFLKRLEAGTLIGTQAGTQLTVITICNYCVWQNGGTRSGTEAGTRSGTNHKKDNKEGYKTYTPRAREEDEDVEQGSEAGEGDDTQAGGDQPELFGEEGSGAGGGGKGGSGGAGADRGGRRKAKSTPTRIAADWWPNEKAIAHFAEVGGLDLDAAVGHFIRHWQTEQVARADWHRTWLKWCNNGVHYGSVGFVAPRGSRSASGTSIGNGAVDVFFAGAFDAACDGREG